MSHGEQFTTTGLDRWQAALDLHVERGAVPGLVALIRRGGAVHVHVAGTMVAGRTAPMQRDTIFRIASMTKPVAAAAAMMLVEEGRLGLDDPVDTFLPELADRRVLKRIDGPLEDTVPAVRPISLRDLMTLRMGLGHIMAQADDYPIRQALTEQVLLMGFPRPQMPPPMDEWIRRVGTLPLMHQPGEQWMYDLGLDVLGVLIARAAGQPLGEFLHDRIFGPLEMKDTGFFVPAEKLDRLATCYGWNGKTGTLDVYDGMEDSQWARCPAFPAASCGLVSTADDYRAFCEMLLGRGIFDGKRLLSPDSVRQMTSDQLTPSQRMAGAVFFGEHSGWGFGMAVNISDGAAHEHPGRFGWDGGFGTSAWSDPGRDLVGILLTQRKMDSPEPPEVFTDFWMATYGALADGH